MNKALLFILCLCTSATMAQEIPVPVNYEIIDSVSGDLDKDGIAELVVAYNSQPDTATFQSIAREIIIYKISDQQWKEWKQSGSALYGSHDGGMDKDPFGSMEIEDGILIIEQDGGSSWNWSSTDKYKFEGDDFYLNGYESTFGKLCEYWEKVDFNLSSGKVEVNKTYESCDDAQKIIKEETETFFQYDLKVTFAKRYDDEILIVSPEYGHQLYLSNGKE